LAGAALLCAKAGAAALSSSPARAREIRDTVARALGHRS
jgi:hypothetical protein